MPNNLTIIVAVAADGGIGRRGDLLFHLRGDLRRFKQLTLGHPIIMGRKTFESFPNGALPGRRNIVITRNPQWSAPGAETAPSLDEALRLADTDTEIYVVGGASIYAEALPLADKLELTEIDATAADADTFFPSIDANEWTIAETSEPQRDEASKLSYRFKTLIRKN